MLLPKEDVGLFYKLHPQLLFYANKKLKILPKISTLKKFLDETLIEQKLKIRNSLYEHLELIDSFVKDNPPGFTSQELDIILNWKFLLRGDFYIIRHLKNYSAFLGSGASTHVYGVLGINDPLDLYIAPRVPVLVKTVLLPFKGNIIYDGFMQSYNISFGPGIRKNLDGVYQEAKSRYGIITSLPFSSKNANENQFDLLKFYLKNKENRENYWNEIQTLISKDKKLLAFYYQEIARINSRNIKKRLKEMGFTNTWFAVLEDSVVASAKSKTALQSNLKAVLPKEKHDFIHIFNLKK